MNLKLIRPLALLMAFAPTLMAQDAKAKRLGSIVTVAVEEYGKAVNDAGTLISATELKETADFLKEAHEVAASLVLPGADSVRAVLDALLAATNVHRPPAEVRELDLRLMRALGPAGAIDLPEQTPDSARGAAIYQTVCVSCHGDRAMGDGPAARFIDKKPAPIGDRGQTPELTPVIAYHIVSVGVGGTPMAGFAGTLTPQQRWDVVRYVFALRGEAMPMAVAVAQDATATVAVSARTVMALLDSALAFAREGQIAAAGDRAFDAYLAFEPLETRARAKRPSLIASMEQRFAEFKGALKRSDVHGAQGARDAIASHLDEVVALATPTEGGWSAFLESFLIILREGFEAILVIGAVVALLIKLGHRERLRAIWAGTALGIVASAATAVALKTLFAAIPAGREIVEGATMLVAVAVLFSVSYWLLSKVEAARWQRFIHQRVNAALDAGGGKALALVAFLAVYREGAETALFYQALFTEGNHAGVPLALGLLVGFVALGVILVLFYRYGVRIPMRPFFAVTSLLLYLMAFVFTGRGIRELQEGGVVPSTLIHGFPSLDALGIYPTVQALGAQAVLVVLFVFALVKSMTTTKQEKSR